MASQESFIFAVFAMYGFIFMIYALSGGAIVGLPNATAYVPVAPETAGIADMLIGTLTLVGSFFVIMFVPVTSVWFLVPLNWAIVGTAVYMFLKLARGGG